LYCVDGLISLGSIRPDRLLHLRSVRHHVGRFLTQITAPGSTAGLALAAGVVAVRECRRNRVSVIERTSHAHENAAQVRGCCGC
jgi:hypothetical protein